ncbi:MAG: hypothetical protein K5683_07315 [Prevotella sp.]|nr:hypothetical protein [Prevotella sp.]
MKKKRADVGLIVPGNSRIGGVTFYKRNGKMVGRVSESREKRSNTLPQFIQRQKMRHSTALWKMLRFCETMFMGPGNTYQNFASLANKLPVVYVEKTRMSDASFLMPGIPVSNGTLPSVSLQLGEVNGTAALLTDLKVEEWKYAQKLWLYTAEQQDNGVPRVMFKMRELPFREMTTVDGCLALLGDEFADPMKGWAVVRVIHDRCSAQGIVTRCTFYQQYTTDEALQFSVKSYGGLTEPPFPLPY